MQVNPFSYILNTYVRDINKNPPPEAKRHFGIISGRVLDALEQFFIKDIPFAAKGNYDHMVGLLYNRIRTQCIYAADRDQCPFTLKKDELQMVFNDSYTDIIDVGIFTNKYNWQAIGRLEPASTDNDILKSITYHLNQISYRGSLLEYLMKGSTDPRVLSVLKNRSTKMMEGTYNTIVKNISNYKNH